jgi:hypothetical protein
MMLQPPQNLKASYNAGSILITWQTAPTSYTPTEVTVSLSNGNTGVSWTSPGPQTSYNVPSTRVSKFAGTLVTITVAFADSVHGEHTNAITSVQVPGSPVPTPPPPALVAPVITSIVPKPAAINVSNSITIGWTTSTAYVKFFIKVTQDGAALPQQEVDSRLDSTSTSGSLRVTTIPGFNYTFQVQGVALGSNGDYTYSDWGPTASMTALPNLRSLRQFLQLSGVNPAGASLRALMPRSETLKQFMQIS